MLSHLSWDKREKVVLTSNNWFPTWFLKLHDLYYKIKRITRVRFDGWTMNSWPVSDSLSKCLAVHECHTSMSYWVSISIVVHHFLWGGHFDATWDVVGGVKLQQELEGVYNHGEINGKSKEKDGEEVANMMIYTVAKHALGFIFFPNSSRCGVEQCHFQFDAVSEVTGELCPVRQEGVDTRRSRYFKFIGSQRRIRHVRKLHKSSQEKRNRCESCIFHCRECWSCCWGGNR